MAAAWGRRRHLHPAGGSLTVDSGSASGGSVTAGQSGGAGSGNGQAYGGGIFIQGSQTISFTPAAGTTITESDPIADMTGSQDPTGQTGAGAVAISGGGTLVFGGLNTFTGGTTLSGSGTTLSVVAGGTLGSGRVTLGLSTYLSASTSVSLAGLPPAPSQVSPSPPGKPSRRPPD